MRKGVKMTLKVGQTVRITSKLESMLDDKDDIITSTGDAIWITQEMLCWAGKEATLCAYRECGLWNIAGSSCVWPDTVFEPRNKFNQLVGEEL